MAPFCMRSTIRDSTHRTLFRSATRSTQTRHDDTRAAFRIITRQRPRIFRPRMLSRLLLAHAPHARAARTLCSRSTTERA